MTAQNDVAVIDQLRKLVTEYDANPDDPGFVKRAQHAIEQMSLASRAAYYTKLKKMICQLRDPVFPATYDEQILAVTKAFPTQLEYINTFVHLSQWKQYRLTRKWVKRPESPVQSALSKVEIIPADLNRGLKLSIINASKLGDVQRSNLEKKVSHKLAVDVQTIMALLQGVKSSDRGPLYIACGLACGRRRIELLGTGTFKPIEGRPMMALFSGQAKKLEESAPYPIPLLVPYTLFIQALKRLRKLMPDLSNLNNEEISKKTATMTNRYCERATPESWGKKHLTAHSLRGLYAVMCATLFNDNTKCDDALYIRQILGTDTMSVSSHYDVYTIINVKDFVPIAPSPPADLEHEKQEGKRNVDGWRGDEKRIAGCKELMAKHKRITPGGLLVEVGGAIPVHKKFIELNRDLINMYHLTV